MMNILDGLTKTKHLRNYNYPKYIWLILLGIFLQTSVWGQTSGPVLGPVETSDDPYAFCAFDSWLAERMTDPVFVEDFNSVQNFVYDVFVGNQNPPANSNGLLRIPVVFHIYAHPETPLGMEENL